ncbi:MAG: VOC family protein [Natronomonas sp.]|uniref:VOC family protein n=1 Tax=Natronomonas sp. TaxID=2184060 RepID=UPI002870407D|nr:VOC family protein [Natronomonas sp.]MDR9431908.1 VOC family protein [Natronomonas sp.]
MSVIHTALWVSNLEATKAFYMDTLGFEHQLDFEWPTDAEDSVTNYYVGRGNVAELQFRYDPSRMAAIEPSGIDHIAIAVEEVDAEFDRIVEETGCPVVTEPVNISPANNRVAFIEDPDGYVVELVEDLG